MTIWLPRGMDRSGIIYKSIADSIADDIEKGELRPGSRLPAQRELADELGVTLTTVTRAYAEAERRGLVVGQVGRGTFVRESDFGTKEGSSEIDLTMNTLLPKPQAEQLMEKLVIAMSRPGRARMLSYHLRAGTDHHREAGARWIRRYGLNAPRERVLVTSGAQHAMAITLATVTEPGETVLTEEFTYSGMKSLASYLHLRLRGVSMDEEGLRPDSLEQACREDSARVLYCMPTIQNPTASVMSLERRREIAAVARAHDLLVVEDDTYGFLVNDSHPLTALAPERCFYITSTSKSLAPGARVGFLLVPEGMTEKLTAAIFATMVMASPVTAEAVTEWIMDGTADRIVQWKRGEVAARQELAGRVLKDWTVCTHPSSLHLWLRLPDPWRGAELVSQARSKGVLVASAEDFVVGRREASDAVRICLGPPENRSILERGLQIVAGIVRSSPELSRALV